MWRGKSLITGLWDTQILLGSRRLVCSDNYIPIFVCTDSQLKKSIKFHSDHFNAYSSSHCNGICIWRRTLSENLQCWTLSWGWGFYNLFSLLLLSFIVEHSFFCFVICVPCWPMIMNQARFFFQQLISGVSYCHAMVIEFPIPIHSLQLKL